MKRSGRVILLLVFTAGLFFVSRGETTYFLVGRYYQVQVLDPTGKNDSYVLPLLEPGDIDYARYLIARNRAGNLDGDRAVVVASVRAGSAGINRNFLSPQLPEWSWHVAEFFEFAEGGIETLDGTPTILERDPDWYTGTSVRKGIIGFAVYTVVRELGSVPLYLSIAPESQNLNFYWSGVGTNYQYTLEFKESLTSTNWLALPGASWPLNTNQWTLPLTNAVARFYRVRAEQAQ